MDPSTKIPAWKLRLASALARANHCHTYVDNWRPVGRGAYYQNAMHGIALVGRPSDVETVRYFYEWLVKEVDRLTERDGRGNGRTWCNNFRLGVVDTIGRKVKEQRAKTEHDMRREAQESADGRFALVKVNNAIEKFEARAGEAQQWANDNLKLVSRGGGGARYDSEARAAGREAGESISFGGKPLGAGARKMLGGK
jgi:hypothetical protein